MESSKSEVNTSDKLEIRDQRMKLLNMVCATLIHEGRYYSSADKTKTVLTTLVNQMAKVDPEFVLKIALYVRDDLNIRSTSNFLVALAANNKACQPFFKKYFTTIMRLPSDMLEVVSLYLALPERYLASTAIPSSLRKAIEKKFPDFDAYQLAKYNKERSQKRKLQKNKTKMEIPKETEKPSLLTLKQLIRKVHLSDPADMVMGIVGKKYPANPEHFEKSGLLGEWDASKSGKRMRLPTPETWETLLSAKGNKNTTWEELIDHKKLPFMAMLRNLRNLIITGISPKHHEIIINRLTDEKSITTSRQLPWRFLSAYEAINIDLEKLMNDMLDWDGSEEKVVQVKVKGKKGKQMGGMRTIKKRVIIPVHMPDIPLIERYRESIDTAIRLSTLHNLKPIEGRTVIFCDVSGSMDCPCSTRGNMGGLQKVKDIAILLGLMCQDICEDVDFRIFSSPGDATKGRCDLEVKLEPNTILKNVNRVWEAAGNLGGGTDFPYDYLEDLISKKIKIDTFIIFSDMMIAPGHNEMEVRNTNVSEILHKYRTTVNQDLLFVAVDLYGNGKSVVDINVDNPKNVLITGFSDNILSSFQI